MENNHSRRRWVTFFTHLIIICILLVLPDLLFSASRSHWNYTGAWAMSIYFKAVVMMAVFYIEYYAIIGRTLLSKRIWAFLGFSFLLIIAALVALYIGQDYILPHPPKHGRPHEISTWNSILRQASFLLRDAGLLTLVIALCVALKLSENWTRIEKRHEKLLASQKADELQNLKNQLNPHFLFNTLNTIYALIAVSPEKAQDAVHELSTLLRYVLYENPEKVSLSREIAFLKSYCSLMETRMGDGTVKFSFDVHDDPEVAPMLIVPLVENAFKHGKSHDASHPIEVTITADEGGAIYCKITNSYEPKPSNGQGGIGIANLRRRLQLIYGKDASLVTNADGSTYQAVLTIK
ncbi:MAG: sensor histidine kinase [Clostridium sp.]|nr:sensor histidine kinase [Clostridium sp.]